MYLILNISNFINNTLIQFDVLIKKITRHKQTYKQYRSRNLISRGRFLLENRYNMLNRRNKWIQDDDLMISSDLRNRKVFFVGGVKLLMYSGIVVSLLQETLCFICILHPQLRRINDGIAKRFYVLPVLY